MKGGMMTDDIVATIARATADQLAPELGARLPIEVEAALYSGGYDDGQPTQYFDVMGVGGLIVSLAQLAWSIYDGYRKKGQQPPTAPVLAREVRVKQREMTHVDGTQEKIIEYVVIETLKAAG
jgi:hypothetical protein